MQPSKQWKMSINARAEKFHLRFKVKKTNPTWKFLKSSLFLKLHYFFLHVKTESTPRHTPTTLKSKFLKLFCKFRTPLAKKRPILQNPETKIPSHPPKRFAKEEPICVGSLFVVNVALLSKSISDKDQQGIIIHGLSVLLFLALFFKKCVAGKLNTTLVVFLAIALLFCALIMFPLDNYYGTKAHVFHLVRKVWNLATSLDRDVLAQVKVTLSRFFQSVGGSFLGSSNWID